MVIVWLISLAIASPIILLSILDPQNVMNDDQQCGIFNNYFLVYGSLAAFFIPLVIMLLAYALTIRLLSLQVSGREALILLLSTVVTTLYDTLLECIYQVVSTSIIKSNCGYQEKYFAHNH